MDSLPFAAIFEHLTDAVLILDQNERIIYGNNEFYNITQLHKTKRINCHISEIADVTRLPKCKIFETYIITQDKSRLAVEFSLSTVPDWPNRTILIGRKLENRKWRDTIHKIGYESSLDSIVVHDLEGNLIDCNKTCCQLLGYTPEEITSMHLRDIEGNFDPVVTVEVFKYLTAGDKARQGPIAEECRKILENLPWPGLHIRKDGTKFPVEVVISTDVSTDRTLIVANCRDASAKEREAQLSQARLQAEAASQAKSAFLSMISHEIRTPLNGILGMLQLVRDTTLNKMQSEYIEIAYRSAKLLLTIIGDILDLQRIESGKLQLEQIGFDLWSIVTESRDLFKPLAHKKAIVLRLNDPIDMCSNTFGSLSSSVSTIESSPREVSRDFKKMSLDCGSSSSSNDEFDSIPWVIGDPTRLQQILGNLLSNAIKFTPKHGEIELNVFVNDYTDNEIELRFEVVDNGVGISKEAQTRLFQPFVQAEQSTTRKYGGSGLGLSICKHIVQMMNGEIGVESEADRGSTFWFSLRFKLYRDTSNQLVYAHMSARENEIPLVVDEDSKKPTDLNLVVQTTEDRLKENDERRVKKKYSNLALSTKNHHLHSTSYDAFKNECTDKPSPKVDQRGGLKILLVEDNSLNQKVAKKMLNKLNISDDNIALAENGQQAVEFITSGNNFDLVFMDVHMPVLDGIEATKQIRQWEVEHTQQLKSPRLPIIALTASNEIDEKHDLIGLDGLILKPLALDKLRSTLDKYLPQWRIEKK